MAESDAVVEFLICFAATCELLGYPRWVDRQLLRKHLITAEQILDGAHSDDDDSHAMTEFVESLRESILSRNSCSGPE